MDNKKMTLFTNGCSWTWGGSLEESIREQSVWPAHLGEMLNRSVVNLGAGCGSNQRIARTTFNWLTQQDPNTLENTLAVIQWTDEARYEYYVHNDNRPEEDNWARVKIDNVQSWNEDDLERIYKRASYRLETFTEKEGAYLMLNFTTTLATMFNHYKVKYYFWSPSIYRPGYPNNVMQYMHNTQNWLDFSGDYERISKHDSHPSVYGHKQIATRIHNLIK